MNYKSRSSQRRRIACAICLFLSVVCAAVRLSTDVSANRERHKPLTLTPESSSEPNTVRALAAYGNLPLAFIPNRGQLDARVSYAVEAGNAQFYFGPKRIQLVFAEGQARRNLGLSFVGAHPAPEITSAGSTLGTVNYIRGNDPASWHTGILTYSEIVYRNLWPGIDLRFRGENGFLKYEFHVAPNADPRNIQLSYEGIERLSVANDGSLQVQTVYGVLRDAHPVSYQEFAGRKIDVRSHYRVSGNTYGFEIGTYDSNRPLIIDPSLAYSTFLGGGAGDVGFGIVVDASGSAYITGETGASNFPTTAGAFDQTFNGGTALGRGDVFITKLNPEGSAVEYSTYIGGANNEVAEAIAVDAEGNAYITGSTDSTDYPTTALAFDTTDNVGTDAFVTKLNASGTALVYSSYLGGSQTGVLGGGARDFGNGIAVDLAGNAYVAGSTDSRDFPTTAGAFDTSYTSGAGSHVFVTKVNASGSSLVYSTYLGGATGENAAGIVIDSEGNAFITGTTRSAGFPTTAGAFDTTPFFGTQEVFVTKLNVDGNGLIYSTFLGGGASDQGTGIAIDAEGNAYVTGWGNSLDFPTTPGAFDTTGDSGEAFISKLNAEGSSLVYSTYLGGTSTENCWAIAVDAAGNAIVTGATISADFPTTVGAVDRTHNGALDVFLTKLNTTGASILYSTLLGGANSEEGRAVFASATSAVYVTGRATSNTFPTTAGSFQPVLGGGIGGDAFVLKISNQSPVAADDDVSTDEDTSVTVDSASNDTDADGDPLVITQVTQGANGSVTISNDNKVSYAPSPNFNGSDSFTYVVADTWGDTATATVNVTVNPVNDAPVASDVSATTQEDQSVPINLLASDVDSAQLTFEVISGPTNGSVGPINNGTISYTPNPNFNGSDSFTFKANDGFVDSNVATVTVTVAPVNDVPVASADFYSTNANTTLVVAAPGVLTNDTDIDGDALLAMLVTNSSHGTLSLAADGSFTYTPNLNFFGADSFSYLASDGTANSNAVTVDITVVNNVIVFSSTRDGNAEIYAMGADGSSVTRITTDPAMDVFPVSSPDRTRIAFNSDRAGGFEVFVMNSDGTGVTRLTTGALAEGPVAWSRDGSRLAFSSRRDGNPEIYVMNSDGTGQQRLTKQRGIDIKPSWSPDGTRILFASDRKRSFEIYAMNADGTNIDQLTKNSFSDLNPAWSPDGTKIAFSTDRDGNFEIYTMNSDGSGLTRLTFSAGVDDEPAWSFAGSGILFTSHRDGNSEIYIMNADGSGQTRLTNHPADDTSPN